MDPSSALAGVEFCYRCGKVVIEICQTWRNAEDEVTQRITIVENCWTRTRLQIDFIQRISKSLDAEHRRVLNDTLGRLATTLSSAISKIQKVHDKTSDARPGFLAFASRVRRGKYVLVKSTLDEVILELEDWQRRFDPSFYLIMRIADPVIDEQLKEATKQAKEQRRTASAASATAGAGNQQGQGSPAQSSSRTARVNERSPLTIADGVRNVLRPDPPHVSIFLPHQPLETISIPFSKAQAACRRTHAGTQWFILDTLHIRPSSNVNAVTEDVRKLARKLSRADPLTFGLLNCKGAMRMLDAQRRGVIGFQLILRAPEGMEILQSLRQVLLNSPVSGNTGPDGIGTEGMSMSLTRRVRIAKELAKSISYVHTFNFVHKNISPESILLFEDLSSSHSATFLVGFDDFRSVDGGTALIGDVSWEKNVYRHPSRQGEFPEEAYRMQHDVYSLGVCLLEIGLWESFVDYTTDDPQLPRYGKSYNNFMIWVRGQSEGSDQQSSNASYMGFMASKLKEYLVLLARSQLPQKMGDRYAEIVVSCLTCLDEEGNGFDDWDPDEDDIRLGVRFNDRILGRLNEIII